MNDMDMNGAYRQLDGLRGPRIAFPGQQLCIRFGCFTVVNRVSCEALYAVWLGRREKELYNSTFWLILIEKYFQASK